MVRKLTNKGKSKKLSISENKMDSYDYLELAYEAQSEKEALKYAQKSLECDKENLDAELMIADLTSETIFEMIDKLETVLKNSKKVLTKRGYFDEENIGDFWLITETRPYMRAKKKYADILIESGSLGKAVKECEEMIRLNNSDNLGVRYKLMNLYALFENDKKALNLHKEYDNSSEVQLLLPLSILYYKKRQFDKAEKYLREIEKEVKETKEFFKDVIEEKIEKYLYVVEEMTYSPYSVDELVISFTENGFLYFTTPGYVQWAYEILTKTNKVKNDKNNIVKDDKKTERNDKNKNRRK